MWIPNSSIRTIGSVVLLVFGVAIAQCVLGLLMEGAWILEGTIAVVLFLGITCLSQGVVSFVTTAPIWHLARHRIAWTSLDHAVLVVPWGTWALLVLLIRHDKSFVNILLEGTAVGLAAPLAALLRVAVGSRIRHAYATIPSLVVCILISVGVWAMVPFLGE